MALPEPLQPLRKIGYGRPMKFTQDISSGQNVIRAYSEGRISINGIAFEESLIITPATIIEQWRPQRFEDLCEDDFAAAVALEPQLVILGTGDRHAFPHPSLLRLLVERGIGLESMSTAAACRTYNILVSEGRQVAAALIIR